MTKRTKAYLNRNKNVIGQLFDMKSIKKQAFEVQKRMNNIISQIRHLRELNADNLFSKNN